MAVRTQCPRCKQPLSVPNKLAGSYASCPRCQGRFWVSKDAPLDPSAGDSVAAPPVSTLTLTPLPNAAPPIAVPPSRPVPPPAAPSLGLAGPSPASAGMASPATPPPRHYFPSVTPLAQAPAAPPGVAPAASPPSNGALVAPPAAPPQARKVARLVTAEAAQSNLKLAADGQLPCLQLQESDKKDKGQGKSRSIPPLVMIGAWILSVAVTAAIVLLTSSGDDATVTTDAKRDALAVIEKDFFGDPARGELLPHQRLLREAREARARGDLKAERQYYRKVLDLLHTESPSATAGKTSRNRLEKGITGSRENDRILEQKILTILGD